MATPTQLLDAFLQWGLKKTNFNVSKGWVFQCKASPGKGQKGREVQPVYYINGIREGLTNKVRGRARISEDKSWQIVKVKFPEAYHKLEALRQPATD